MYKIYGDKKIIAEFYGSMKKYINYMIKDSKNYIRPEYGYGDWLSAGKETSKSFIGTAFFAYDVFLMKEISKVLNKRNDAKIFEFLFQEIKKQFNKKFVSPDGSLKRKPKLLIH